MSISGVLRRIRCWNVMLGIWATILFAVLLTAFVASPINSHLYGVFQVERPGGAGSFTGRAWDTYVLFSTSLQVFAMLLALFLGGIVVGGSGSSSPGLNGATTAALLVAIVLACLLGSALVSLLDPVDNPGEVYTQAENLQMSLVFVTASCVILPFATLVGYIGGTLGGRLRGTVANRSTA